MGRARVVAVAEAPAEALRLLNGLADALVAEAGPAAAEAVPALEEAVRSGTLPGLLWVGPKDEAVGIAWWEPPSEAGRRAGLYLAEGYRHEAALRGLLDAVDAADGGPLLEVADRIPGVPPAVRQKVLAERGFRPVSRVDLGWPVGAPPPPRTEVAEGRARRLGPDDAAALALLLDSAYSDNPVDRALFVQRRDPAADAQSAITLLLGGGLGPWLSAASFGVEVDGALVAATIVNDFHGALITEVMVAPGFRRRGLARALLARTIEVLRHDGRDDIRLAVTVGNDRAYRLYTSLGFLPLAEAPGATWLHEERTGLSVPR